MNSMKTNMTKEEFQEWIDKWFLRVPKCKDFACCHELMSCAIYPLCGCGSIYETYSRQKSPEECTTVDCADCMLKYECKRPRKLMIDSMRHNDRLMRKLAEM